MPRAKGAGTEAPFTVYGDEIVTQPTERASSQEEVLVALARDGDEHAFGELVTRYYFVAQAQDRSCYWIYRDRVSSRDIEKEQSWFLHGLFG